MKKYDIVMFSMSSWNDWEKKGIANRNYHILNKLRKNNKIGKILQVDFLPYTYKRSLRSYYENKIQKSRGEIIKNGLTSILNKIDNNLFVYSTIDSVFSEEKAYNKINKILKELNFQNLILWSYFPMFTGYFDSIKSNIKIFDTVDNWIEHPNFKKHKERLRKNYITIDQKADLIFTVSEDLKKLFTTNENVHWIPNGVDVENFRIQDTEFKIINKKSQPIKKPIVGYVGIIQDRIDIELIEYVAKINPDKSIVLIGDVWPDANIENLKNKNNIHFLSRIEYKELPKYIHQFDVAIIPHKVNNFTASMNPLKLYEYLACGKPVVTTPVAGIEKFRDLIYIASEKEEFNNKIQKALQENNKNLEQKRSDSVKDYSWESRINEMMSYIDEFIFK